jgi:hypothetical protein
LEVLVMSEGYELTEDDLALSEEEIAYWAAVADADEFAARDWRHLQRFEELLCHGGFSALGFCVGGRCGVGGSGGGGGLSGDGRVGAALLRLVRSVH